MPGANPAPDVSGGRACARAWRRAGRRAPAAPAAGRPRTWLMWRAAIRTPGFAAYDVRGPHKLSASVLLYRRPPGARDVDWRAHALPASPAAVRARRPRHRG